MLPSFFPLQHFLLRNIIPYIPTDSRESSRVHWVRSKTWVIAQLSSRSLGTVAALVPQLEFAKPDILQEVE
jgi:hypothetical protein